MGSVSVVIPCYKYGHFLEEAVASVLDDQPGVEVRVLIIDDASPDDSAETARKIAAREPRVELSLHETNKGNIATFNEGLLEWADGDYTLLLSADDRATPGALRRARDLLDANPDVGFVYGHSLYFTEGLPVPAARTGSPSWSVWPGSWWLEHRFRQAENPITSPEIIVRTSLQKHVGGYDPELPKAADMEMYMRLAAHADVGFLKGVDQAFYRVHGHNMSGSVSALMDLVQRRSVFEVVLERYGESIPDAGRLSGLVHRKLAQEALWAAGRVYGRGPIRRSGPGAKLMGTVPGEEEKDVDELLAFAADCWPGAVGLPIYRTLRARKRLGPRDMYFLLNEKGQWWLRRQGWKRRGF